MSETKEITRLKNEFESKFGFVAYENLKSKLLAPMYEKIRQLEISRDNWKEKYMGLKTKSKHN